MTRVLRLLFILFFVFLCITVALSFKFFAGIDNCMWRKKSVRMNFPVIRMINECVRILWLVTGVLGCTFGISNLKIKDYGCITERD